MAILEEQQRLALAAWVAGISAAELQLRLLEAAIASGLTPAAPRLRLVSNLHGIEIDPEFIKGT